jgi:hypothetical protein
MEKLNSLNRIMEYLTDEGFFETDHAQRHDNIERKLTDLIIEVHEITIRPIQSAIENNKMT